MVVEQHPRPANAARRVLLPFLTLLAAAACTPATPPGEPPTGQQSAAAAAAFDATRLPAFHWKLIEASAPDGSRIEALFPRADKPLQLDFADGRVSVSNACNRIGGGYALNGDTLSVGSLVMTRMACADSALMQSDAQIAQRLEAGGTLRFDGGDALVYTTAAGDTLRFAGEPTPDTRHGGPGERVFLEVAPQRVPCPHAMIPDYQCLHVREIIYDDDGLKQGQGQWRFLYQDIEGYTHEPGVRNVLRLKRYDIANPPADASSVAYVLDVVVESETIGR